VNGNAWFATPSNSTIGFTAPEGSTQIDLSTASQQFGGRRSARAGAWKNALKRGDASGLRKELRDLKSAARKLAGMKDSPEKDKLRRSLERRMNALRNFAAGELGSAELRSSLERALEQLQLANLESFKDQAFEALQETLDLTDREVEGICKSIQNLAALEDALRALQAGKACDQAGLTPGSMPDQLDALEAYEDYFNSLLEGAGLAGMGGKGKPGQGRGMGNQGMGRGGVAPEDEKQKTAFKSERSRSALRAGKLLLKWKTQGDAPPGRASEDYRVCWLRTRTSIRPRQMCSMPRRTTRRTSGLRVRCCSRSRGFRGGGRSSSPPAIDRRRPCP